MSVRHLSPPRGLQHLKEKSLTSRTLLHIENGGEKKRGASSVVVKI